MTLKIQRSAEGEGVAFTLSGRINMEEVVELQKLFEAEGQDHHIILDLKEVKLVDQDAVRFLARCEANAGPQLVALALALLLVGVDAVPAPSRHVLHAEKLADRGGQAGAAVAATAQLARGCGNGRAPDPLLRLWRRDSGQDDRPPRWG